MTTPDPSHSLKAAELIRSIAEKIAAGATMPNANASEFFQKMRVRNAQWGIQMRVTARELVFLSGINERLKGRKRK